MITWFILIVLIILFVFLLKHGCCTKFEGFDSNQNTGPQSDSNQPVRFGIVSMMKRPDNIEHWFRHHRDMGISRFYIRLEETEDMEDWFRAQPDVVLTIGKSRGVNEYQDIQKRQGMMVTEALANALADESLDWLIHMDADELLEGSLDAIGSLPESVRTCWMENEEAVYDGIPADSTCFQAVRFRSCLQENDMPCASYANGKGAGRVAADVEFGGPHRFRTKGKKEAKPNYGKKVKGLKIRHYESCNYGAYKAKFANLANNDSSLNKSSLSESTLNKEISLNKSSSKDKDKSLKQDNIPFSYYNEAIQAIQTGSDDTLECVYTKFRTDQGGPDMNCFS